jgi:hypothetical protein
MRGYVARNPNTPQESLNKLANDKNKYVGRGVARNPNTPQETLNKLADDED